MWIKMFVCVYAEIVQLTFIILHHQQRHVNIRSDEIEVTVVACIISGRMTHIYGLIFNPLE